MSDTGIPSRASSWESGSSISDWELPTRLMCPIFRPLSLSPPTLEYQCSEARGMASAALLLLRVSSMLPDDAPRTLTMAADSTIISVLPRGKPQIPRRWFSNCEHTHAFCV
jgi:hypothetical protein